MRVPWYAAAAGAAVLLAGCGGSSGGAAATAGASGSATAAAGTSATTTATASVTTSPTASPTSRDLASTSAAAILAASKAAFAKAPTVHLKGTFVENGKSTGMDIRFKRGAGAHGVITLDGNDLELIRAGKVAYIKGTTAFWTATLNADAAKLLGGKYLKVSSTSKSFAPLLTATDVDSFAKELFTPKGPVTKGGVSTVTGKRAIALVDSDGSKLYVSLQGPAYPLEIDPPPSSGSGQGFTLSDYGAPVPLTPPPASQVLSVPVP